MQAIGYKFRDKRSEKKSSSEKVQGRTNAKKSVVLQ